MRRASDAGCSFGQRMGVHDEATASACWASARSTELIEIISVEAWCGGAAGTMIMVATRRNEANDRPSIISSSVMT